LGHEKVKGNYPVKIAMMKKSIILVMVAGLAVNAAYSQGRAADSVAQVKQGEVVPIGDGLMVKVIKATTSFAGVKLKGEPVVVALEMDAGKKGATLFYKLSRDPGSSEVLLMSGSKKLAPRAVIEDFPSWGQDNDKEIDGLDPKETVGGTTLTFQQKGTISILFDVPPEEAKTPKKLSVMLRVVLPTNVQRSFVVPL